MRLRTFELATFTRLCGAGPADKGNQCNFSILFFSARAQKSYTDPVYPEAVQFPCVEAWRVRGVSEAAAESDRGNFGPRSSQEQLTRRNSHSDSGLVSFHDQVQIF